MRRFLIILPLLVLAACATSYTPRANTRSDLTAYVERAAALVQREGVVACETFSKPAWFRGEWYIFIAGVGDDVLHCHPARPEMVGQRQSEIQDVNGVYLGREMTARVDSPAGRGWVEYMWPRPGQTTPVPKSSYVIGVTGPDGKRYIVGSGGYELSGS